MDSQNCDGLKKLVLNNAFKDPTLLREKLMLDFLRAHNIAAPRATFARLYVNDHYWGLYSVVEDVSKPFLEQRFGNKDGNLFKGDPKGSLGWKGWEQANYTNDYELKTNESENDWSDLIRFINALNNTPPLQLPDSLDHYLNLDSWFSYWAAHNLFVNLDSYVGSGHNYFLYHNTDTDKFEWITWDVNEAFANFQMNIPLNNLKTMPFTFIPQPPNSRPMMNKLLPNDNYKQLLAERLCALLADFNNDALDSRIDSLADLVRPHVYADTLKFFSNQRFEDNIEQDINAPAPGAPTLAGLKPFIAARYESLTQQLADYGCTLSGTDNGAAPEGLQLYPNPAAGSARLDAGAVSLNEIRLFDSQGRLWRRWRPAGTTVFDLPLENLPAGVYYLWVNAGEALHLRRLCVVR